MFQNPEGGDIMQDEWKGEKVRRWEGRVNSKYRDPIDQNEIL